MDTFLSMSPAQAAALHIGLLTFVMFMLKGYVGRQRYRLGAPPGDVSNPEFARATRVQLNAVEDVPLLLVGLAALALLGMPAWYIHAAGLTLLISRILHAWGLAMSGGTSFGRAAGTLGTTLVYLAVGGALIVHAFTP